MNSNERFQCAIAAIDAANGEDPTTEVWQGRDYPKELLYGQRMSLCLGQLAPQATEAQRLAARAQHIRRWRVPRSDYPATREGYLQWRSFLYRFHADQAAQVLTEVGYDDETIASVRKMIAKQGIKRDPDVQLVEDTACLVFLGYYFPSFAEQRDDEQLVDIVRKTWRKMSAAGHQQALHLELPERLQAVVAKALSDDAGRE